MTTRRGPQVPMRDLIAAGSPTVIESELTKARTRLVACATLHRSIRPIAEEFHRNTIRELESAKARQMAPQPAIIDPAAPKRVLFR